MVPTMNAARRIDILIGLACLLFILAACSQEQTASDFRQIALEQFPQELGQGFATVGDVSEEHIVVGEIAPDFSFVLADEQGTTLADLQGEPVVINFWATWCGPCRAEMPELVALHEGNPDLTVLAVNVQEDLERAQAFAEAFEMTMPVLLDPEGNVSDVYGVRGLPATIFIDAEGRVASRWDGMLTADLLAEQVAKIQ